MAFRNPDGSGLGEITNPGKKEGESFDLRGWRNALPLAGLWLMEPCSSPGLSCLSKAAAQRLNSVIIKFWGNPSLTGCCGPLPPSPWQGSWGRCTKAAWCPAGTNHDWMRHIFCLANHLILLQYSGRPRRKEKGIFKFHGAVFQAFKACCGWACGRRGNKIAYIS